MSGFSTQTDPAKPANTQEFATEKEVAARLSEAGVNVKSERTIRRYKRDPRTHKILGAVPHGKQWRIPKQQEWRKIARELERLGKAPHVPPGRIFKREMGWGNPRRERETKILRRALDVARVRQKRRPTEKLKWQLEQVWKMAQIIAAKNHCTVFNAPKFFRRYLETANEKERKHNAPRIEWLKRNGLWDQVRNRIKDDALWHYSQPGCKTCAIFDVIEECERKVKKVLIPHRIYLHAVQTKAQLLRKVRELEELWPLQEDIERATAKHNEIWWQLDLERAAKLLRRGKKSITPENLLKVLYRDETVEREKRPGISRSTYFRRYSKADLTRFSCLKVGKELRFPDKKSGGLHDELGLDETDLAKMSIRSADDWESYNPFRDEDE